MGITTNTTKSVRVDLADRAYTVTVGSGILDTLAKTVADRCPASTRALLAIDHNLPQQTVAQVVKTLEQANLSVATHTLTAREDHKTLATHNDMLERMARQGLGRSDLVVALGGGIVGDVAGYAAASYMRGIPIIQCPTTLLAMVDASVGGKTGVNLLLNNDNDKQILLKNYAGAFWQPRAVLADVQTLGSLEPRQFRAGIAECLKHALLSTQTDADLFEWIATNLDAIIQLDASTLIELVTRNVTIKARIVEADEREEASDRPGRAALNLGHTFAHVLESFGQLSPDNDPTHAPLLHGEAVSLGLVAATATSVDLGFVSVASLDSLRQLLASAGLPIYIDNLPDNSALRTRMLQDKKTTASTLRLVLPVEGAGVILTDECSSESIDAGWNAIRA